MIKHRDVFELQICKTSSFMDAKTLMMNPCPACPSTRTTWGAGRGSRAPGSQGGGRVQVRTGFFFCVLTTKYVFYLNLVVTFQMY